MNKKNKIRVLYFGTYSRGEEYARNLALINGLKNLGAEVEECHTELFPKHKDKMQAAKQSFFANIFALLTAYLRLIRAYLRAGDFDFIFVGYIGQLDVFLARLLKIFHQKPIIFDAFYSLYDTMVKDRALYSESSLMASLLRLLDRFSIRCSDLALLDTNEHIKYFCNKFGLEPERFLAVPLGVDQDNFYPRSSVGSRGIRGIAPPAPEEDEVFEVVNYSSYIPLHGIEVILKAADLLRQDKSIHFTLIGKGQLYPEMRTLALKLGLENVNFVEWLNHRELVEKAAAADVLLGIFGTTEKASRVIPYKAYEALALAKPLITGLSPAARELLEDGKHCLLSPMGDEKALADKILLLKKSPELRKSIAQQGHQLFLEKCSWESIATAILKKLNEKFGAN